MEIRLAEFLEQKNFFEKRACRIREPAAHAILPDQEEFPLSFLYPRRGSLCDRPL